MELFEEAGGKNVALRHASRNKHSQNCLKDSANAYNQKLLQLNSGEKKDLVRNPRM